MESDVVRNDIGLVAGQQPTIAQEEYDFSEVPNDELEACTYYEYMRESETIRQAVAGARGQVLQEMDRKKTKNGDVLNVTFRRKRVTRLPKNFEAAIINHLAVTGDFPQKTWQRLSTSRREDLCRFPRQAFRFFQETRAKEYPKLTIETLSENPSLGQRTIDQWIAERNSRALTSGGRIVSGFFQVDMGYAPNELVDAFADWLNAYHPGANKQPREPRGRKGIRDRLNALGALRLRYYCGSLPEAQKMIAPLAKKPHGMAYSTRSAWNRACKAAVTHFLELLRLPASQMPIHFTEGWQKKGPKF